jgi:hypothetical protein
MKKFSQYLTEQKHNYSYRVKLAFKPTPEDMQKIEDVLQRYTVLSISSPKSLPIQAVDKSFPGINSPETYMFEVTVEYPASADFVRHTISNVGFDFQNVSVVDILHDQSIERDDQAIASNKNLLGSDYPKDDNAKISKDNFGDEYNENFVKNSIGSTDKMIPKNLKDIKGKTLNDPEYPIGKDSAVGTNPPTKPAIKSFAR